jgi:hypothetical protein
MSLLQVQDEETVEALRLADRILTIEPGNTMILEYRTALKQIDADEGRYLYLDSVVLCAISISHFDRLSTN